MNDLLIRIKLFFNPGYLFLAYPSPDVTLMPYLLIFFGILLILAIVSSVALKKNRKKPVKALWRHLATWLWWSSIIGFLLLFFRYEGVYFLSMRFILLAWILAIIIWGSWILVYYKKGYQKFLAEYAKQKDKEKYIPRKSRN